MFERTAKIFAAAVLALLLGLPLAVTAAMDKDFDHFSTGFPLTGGHRNVECESCHRSGIFAGTPRQCVVCHTQQEISSGAVKPANHIPSTNECQDCHDNRSWGPVRRIDHAAVFGSCASCHNGFRAAGTPVNHVPVNNWSCEDCHRTSGWMPAHFRHLNVAPGQCETCHVQGGFASTSRPGDALHQVPAILASSCDVCHTTRSWIPARVNHAGFTQTCSSCHNNSPIIGKPANHFVTSLECSSCHNTRAWIPASFGHTNPNFPPDHGRTFACSTCHSGAPQTASNVTVYDYPSGKPYCITCHYRDFRKEHKDSEIPSKKDCLSGCHEHSMRKW